MNLSANALVCYEQPNFEFSTKVDLQTLRHLAAEVGLLDPYSSLSLDFCCLEFATHFNWVTV